MAFNITKKIGGASFSYHKVVDVRLMDLQDPVYDTQGQETGNYNGQTQVKIAPYKDKATRTAGIRDHAPLMTLRIPGVPTGNIDYKEWVYTALFNQAGGEFEAAPRID